MKPLRHFRLEIIKKLSILRLIITIKPTISAWPRRETKMISFVPESYNPETIGAELAEFAKQNIRFEGTDGNILK